MAGMGGLRLLGLGLSGLCWGSLVGCETKISECNKLITIVNRTTDDLSAVQTEAKVNTQNADQMAAQLEQFVSNLEKNTKEMEAIGVDTNLQPFKQKLVNSYKAALKNSRDLAAAVKTKNQRSAQMALNALTNAGASDAQVLKELDTYCKVPQS
jgi:DNA-binding transcriptional regulator YbjK